MPLNDERLLGEFDDTQLEVHGKQFEGARLNYNGDMALSWQTLWWGPLLADSVLTSPGDCSDQLPSLAWKIGEGEQFGVLRHQPDGCVEPKLFACARRKDDLLWRYGFVACDESQSDAVRVFERHALKGDKERLFSEVLSGLDCRP